MKSIETLFFIAYWFISLLWLTHTTGFIIYLNCNISRSSEAKSIFEQWNFRKLKPNHQQSAPKSMRLLVMSLLPSFSPLPFPSWKSHELDILLLATWAYGESNSYDSHHTVLIVQRPEFGNDGLQDQKLAEFIGAAMFLASQFNSSKPHRISCLDPHLIGTLPQPPAHGTSFIPHRRVNSRHSARGLPTKATEFLVQSLWKKEIQQNHGKSVQWHDPWPNLTGWVRLEGWFRLEGLGERYQPNADWKIDWNAGIFKQAKFIHICGSKFDWTLLDP